MKDLESRLDKLYDRMQGEFIKVSLVDGSQASLSRDELLRLLVATIKATASNIIANSEAVSEDEEWLRSEDVAFIQSIAPGQDNVIDLMQSMIASIGRDEDD
ncbi:MAG TPA: hypothetical protein GXX64_01980 [Bacteroidales bacterium]|nr:hypothetical protein [Bacteroidales bacterium]